MYWLKVYNILYPILLEISKQIPTPFQCYIADNDIYIDIKGELDEWANFICAMSDIVSDKDDIKDVLSQTLNTTSLVPEIKSIFTKEKLDKDSSVYFLKNEDDLVIYKIYIGDESISSRALDLNNYNFYIEKFNKMGLDDIDISWLKY